MPNWAIHLIVPPLALLVVSRREDWKYIFEYGFSEYNPGWKNPLRYITDSPGTGALAFVLLAGICFLNRNPLKREV